MFDNLVLLYSHHIFGEQCNVVALGPHLDSKDFGDLLQLLTFIDLNPSTTLSKKLVVVWLISCT